MEERWHCLFTLDINQEAYVYHQTLYLCAHTDISATRSDDKGHRCVGRNSSRMPAAVHDFGDEGRATFSEIT